MIHPSTELKFASAEIGYGVFATEHIPAGTITWALCELDQLIAPERVDGLSDLTQRNLLKYAYLDPNGYRVLCWDNARFVNHHCEANCLPVGFGFEIAVRDIERGEQLTDEYGSLNIEEPFDCCCGSARCRRRIHPTDLLRYSEDWDAKVAGLFPMITSVAQPLWSIVERNREIAAILAGLPVPRARSQYYQRASLVNGSR